MNSAVKMFGELQAKGRIKDFIVKPRTMSHGTMEVYKLSESRRFYEEFLGVETVRHSVGAMAVRCSSSSHVIARRPVGTALHSPPQPTIHAQGADA
jgi:catechol 2,3-dioxygenase-like lactoylglutathione lyase family enzyme